jgi:hypothetical protein
MFSSFIVNIPISGGCLRQSRRSGLCVPAFAPVVFRSAWAYMASESWPELGGNREFLDEAINLRQFIQAFDFKWLYFSVFVGRTGHRAENRGIRPIRAVRFA